MFSICSRLLMQCLLNPLRSWWATKRLRGKSWDMRWTRSSTFWSGTPSTSSLRWPTFSSSTSPSSGSTMETMEARRMTAMNGMTWLENWCPGWGKYFYFDVSRCWWHLIFLLICWFCYKWYLIFWYVGFVTTAWFNFRKLTWQLPTSLSTLQETMPSTSQCHLWN